MKKIYLAGPISGLTFEGAQDWRDAFSAKISPEIACFSPLRDKEYLTMRGPLEGSYEFPSLTDRGITTRDRNDCMGADLVVFNMFGATRVSIGTMIELGWADAARVPAVLVMEKAGNVHEHPMVRETVGFRVDNLLDAISIAEIVLLHKADTERFKRFSNGATENIDTIAYRSMYNIGGMQSGRIDSSKPNQSNTPKKEWIYYAHDFSGAIRGSVPNTYCVCKRCGISDRYVVAMNGPKNCSVSP